MARQRELILFTPRYTEFLGEDFRGLSHIESDHRIGETAQQCNDRFQIHRTKSQQRICASGDTAGAHEPTQPGCHGATE